jgi:hypothetical protein
MSKTRVEALLGVGERATGGAYVYVETKSETLLLLHYRKLGSEDVVESVELVSDGRKDRR